MFVFFQYSIINGINGFGTAQGIGILYDLVQVLGYRKALPRNIITELVGQQGSSFS
jgi:hypothetical protein